MNDLHTILHTLKHRPTMLLPQYAASLSDKIEKYLAGEIELPETNKEESTLNTMVNGIAVINVNGMILKRVGLPKEVLEFFGLVDLDHVDADLKAARDNPEVQAIVLNVNSPGGFISGVVSTANLIDEITKTKEVIVYSDLLNASAAYFISSKASAIIGSIDAEFGSVGVYTTVEDWSKAYENAGVKVHLIKAGTHKALGHSTQPLTDEQKAFLQNEINESWELFKSTVNSKRTISEEDLQGQTFSGEPLVTKGFIDGFASDINEVISALSEDK